MKENRKEYRLLLTIIAVVVFAGWLIASRSPQLDIVLPSGASTLQDHDFAVESDRGSFTIGSSDFDYIKTLYPEGSNLGSSTVYQPKGIDCLFTFTKHENVLKVLHISSGQLCTSRGIKIGDSFSKAVIPSYGNDYGYVKIPGSSADFDAVYGNDTANIVFQVRDERISKIILQHQI